MVLAFLSSGLAISHERYEELRWSRSNYECHQLVAVDINDRFPFFSSSLT